MRAFKILSFLAIILLLSSGCAIVQYSKAYRHYEIALKLDAIDSERAKEKFQKAIDEANRVISKGGHLAEAYAIRGAAYNRLGITKKAIEDLLIARAIKEKSDWVLPLTSMSLGEVYVRRAQSCLKQREEIQRIQDNDERKGLSKASQMAERGYYEAALLFFRAPPVERDALVYEIRAMEDAILAHFVAWDLSGINYLKDPESEKEHREAIERLSKELLYIDITNPIAHHFIGRFSKKDVEDRRISLMHLLIARELGLPKGITYINDLWIKSNLELNQEISAICPEGSNN